MHVRNIPRDPASQSRPNQETDPLRLYHSQLIPELEPTFADLRLAERRGKDPIEAADAFKPIAAAVRDAVTRSEWLAGEAFSVADIMCASILGRFAQYEPSPEFAPLREYVERAVAVPPGFGLTRSTSSVNRPLPGRAPGRIKAERLLL